MKIVDLIEAEIPQIGDEILEKIRNEYSKYFASESQLYRAHQSYDKVVELTPREKDRESKGMSEISWVTGNLAAYDPRWANFPPRARATFVKTDKKLPPISGRRFIAIPHDSVDTVAVCGGSDFNFGKSWPALNETELFRVFGRISYAEAVKGLINAVEKYVGKDHGQRLVRTLDSTLHTLDKIIKQEGGSFDSRYTVNVGGTWTTRVYQAMSPEANNFEVVPTEKVLSGSYPNREVWFEGNCLLLSEPTYNTIIRNGLHKK